LHAQRARGRPCDVRGGLSLRVGRGGRALHRHGAARRQAARGYLLQQCGTPVGSDVTTRILIVEKFADVYARALTKHFTGIEIHKAASAAEIAVDLAAIDVLFAFGIAINHRMIADARTLKWIASLATGVDHFLRCPGLRPETILTSARRTHAPAMRETPASFMGALSRDGAPRVQNKDARLRDRRARGAR